MVPELTLKPSLNAFLSTSETLEQNLFKVDIYIKGQAERTNRKAGPVSINETFDGFACAASSCPELMNAGTP
jgi:hypothetical protein